jgi:hypothetical protein
MEGEKNKILSEGDISLKEDLKELDTILKENWDEIICIFDTYINDDEYDELFFALKATFGDTVEEFFGYFFDSSYDTVMNRIMELKPSKDLISKLIWIYSIYGFKIYNKYMEEKYPKYVKSLANRIKFDFDGTAYLDFKLNLMNGELLTFEGTAVGAIYLLNGIIKPLIVTQRELKKENIKSEINYDDIKEFLNYAKELEKIFKK